MGLCVGKIQANFVNFMSKIHANFVDFGKNSQNLSANLQFLQKNLAFKKLGTKKARK